MISGKNIICFASGWDCHPTSKHHVMRRLAEQNHVIWVNWHASRRPQPRLADLRAIGAKLGEMRRGPRRVSTDLTVVTPGQLPLPGSPLVRRLNAALVRRAIRRVLVDMEPRPVQLWTFAPDMAELVGAFGEELVLYYCVDAFAEFPGYDRAVIERRERELIDASDVVITTSPPLYDAKRSEHRNVHLVQHGVDHGHLSRALTEWLPLPVDLRPLPRPILGFVGMIGEWVDLDLVAGIAHRMPEASIVMVGPVSVSRAPCAGLSNVHWLGAKDHAGLPAYLRFFDLGLIPFKQVPLTYSANPIKLYEYLAAGLPVVSTSMPTVRATPEAVWVADDLSGLVDACRDALVHTGAEARRRRSELMLDESWDARLEQLSAIIDATLARRPISRTSPAAPVAATPDLATSTSAGTT